MQHKISQEIYGRRSEEPERNGARCGGADDYNGSIDADSARDARGSNTYIGTIRASAA
jgi:hypothetical protein